MIQASIDVTLFMTMRVPHTRISLAAVIGSQFHASDAQALLLADISRLHTMGARR